MNSISLNSLSKLAKTETQTGLVAKTETKTGGAVDAGKLAGTCMKALMDNIPPTFCYKRGADFGVIPTGCPPGYFRSLALCYEHCGNNYTHILGICYQPCPAGYINHGLTCFRNLFSWFFKHSYIPSSITNFSDRVPCPTGMYRGGALCYRNCENIGMFNCGIGACVSEPGTCGITIATMVIEVLQGLADAITTIVSLGSSIGAKSVLKSGIKKAGQAAMKAALNSVKKTLTGQFKDIILQKAKNAIKDQFKDIVKGHVTELTVKTVCKTVWDSAITKSISTPEVSLDKLADAVDIFNVKGIMTECKDTTTEAGSISCASNIMSGLAAFDPTGLLTIANAFMKPTCDVPAKAIVPTKDDEAITAAIASSTNTVDPDADCIVLYEHCGYTGKSERICSDKTFVSMNDQASSMKVGNNVSGLLFEHAAYQGRQMPFAAGSSIKCFKDLSTKEVNLDDLVSSVAFNVDKCLIINYSRKDEKDPGSSSNLIGCTTAPNINIIIPSDLANLRFRTFRMGTTFTLYAGINYTGASYTVSSSSDADLTKFNLFVIKSFKVTKA